MATHVEVMARVLRNSGVEYVFGLPGGEILAFIDACRREGLRFLLTGHESSAAWIAQVLGQITGIPGVCAATLGPGATNLVTGVANAFLDRAPLLAVTAETAQAAAATMTHQRLPLSALFGPITKASISIGAGDTTAVMRDSLHLALRPRCGPVHIAVPSDVAGKESVTAEAMPATPTREAAGGVNEIIARLETAQRPLVLIGLGARSATAAVVHALIGGLIDKLQAPFLVTPKVKGIVSEDHPLFLGVATGMAIDREIVETIHSADLLVAIGFDPVECDKTWFAGLDVISIDDASMAEGDYHPLEAIGDIVALLADFAAAISGPKPWPPDLLESRRRAILPRPIESAGKMSPLRVIEELRSVFPRDGIATCDVGSHKLAMGQFWRAYEPGTFFMSNGLSGMGFGLPAAIAAQLAYPNRPVVAVVGDGGMLMMVHDLVLMRELVLPIITVVLTDHSLSLIRVGAERRGYPPYGVDFSPPNFAALAQAFGIASRRVTQIAELKTCVDQALTLRIPFVIEATIDYREYYDLV